MRLERIPEEDQHVDLAIGAPGADLLVAAERAAAQAGHRQPEFGHEEVTGRASRAQVVPGEQPPVEPGPLREVALLVVMRDQGNSAPDRVLGLERRAARLPDGRFRAANA
jgi:hypothetical protein